MYGIVCRKENFQELDRIYSIEAVSPTRDFLDWKDRRQKTRKYREDSLSNSSDSALNWRQKRPTSVQVPMRALYNLSDVQVPPARHQRNNVITQLCPTLYIQSDCPTTRSEIYSAVKPYWKSEYWKNKPAIMLMHVALCASREKREL